MASEDQQLADYCGVLQQAVLDGIGWFEGNAPRLRQDTSGLVREMRRFAVEARRLDQAAERKVSVGVFGPSQAGKSYLISALARRGANPLMADFGGSAKDFLAEINPPGGTESTGLVTRFTMDRPADLPPSYPVELALLDEIELVKILANTYFSDFKRPTDFDYDVYRDGVLKKLEAMRARPTAKGVGPLSPIDVVDLEDYCTRRLKDDPRVEILSGKTPFWTVAADLAPTLAPADRADLFATLWADTPEFTNVLKRLTTVLQRLGWPRTVHASFDSLADRSRSIITVDTLSGIGGGDTDSVEVRAPNGTIDKVLRNELAALTAELKIVIKDQPFEFFSHTDLLDFPGYRSRQKFENMGEYLAASGMREPMIRGKVAYLFERYSDNNELNCMLLCQGPENFEVKDLPRPVYDWVRKTHGEKPEARRKDQTSLFFVLTKFDKTAFEESAGKTLDGTRFVKRLEESLIKSYGAEAYENGDKAWPLAWTAGAAFDNVYPLRNPTIPLENILECQTDPVTRHHHELKVRDDKIAYLQTLRKAFTEDEKIVAHVGDAAAAWDAMMRLNDGGITRIAERLAPVCNPALKRAQIAGRARALRASVLARLSPFHVSGDITEERKKKREMARRLAGKLYHKSRRPKFAGLLAAMQVAAEDIYDLCLVVERLPLEQLAGTSADTGKGDDKAAPPPPAEDEEADDFLASLGFDGPAKKAAPAGGAKPASALDRPALLAREIERQWEKGLRALASDPAARNWFDLTVEDLSDLTEEMLVGARRLALRDRIAGQVRQGAAFKNMDKEALIWKQATPAALSINEFVATLAFGGVFAPEGTTVSQGGQDMRLFQPPPPIRTQDFPKLAPERVPHGPTYVRDWIAGLVKVIDDNVEFAAGAAVDLEQNDRIGAILSRAATAPASLQS